MKTKAYRAIWLCSQVAIYPSTNISTQTILFLGAASPPTPPLLLIHSLRFQSPSSFPNLLFRHVLFGARNAEGKWHLYTSQSLPFGSIASVYAFNKSARALQHLLLEDFHIMTTNDFLTVDLEVSREITTGIVSQVFQILGWKHAVAGKKAKPFSKTFGALGVEYNLEKIHKGYFTVGNKQERLERIGRMIARWRQKGKCFSQRQLQYMDC